MSYEEEPGRRRRRLSILLNNKRGSALKTSIDGLLEVAVNELSEFKVKRLLGAKIVFCGRPSCHQRFSGGD